MIPQSGGTEPKGWSPDGGHPFFLFVWFLLSQVCFRKLVSWAPVRLCVLRVHTRLGTQVEGNTQTEAVRKPKQYANRSSTQAKMSRTTETCRSSGVGQTSALHREVALHVETAFHLETVLHAKALLCTETVLPASWHFERELVSLNQLLSTSVSQSVPLNQCFSGGVPSGKRSLSERAVSQKGRCLGEGSLSGSRSFQKVSL